jgi:hypothetical protein
MWLTALDRTAGPAVCSPYRRWLVSFYADIVAGCRFYFCVAWRGERVEMRLMVRVWMLDVLL